MKKICKLFLSFIKDIFYFSVNAVLFCFFKNFFYNIIRFVDNCIFLYEGIKLKMSFINLRLFQLPGYHSHYKENSREFNDFDTSIPIYKIFFVINKALVRSYNFYFRLANRLIQPISQFFEPFNKNRRLFYRFNIFPRKYYKERLVNLHIIFLKKYFLYKMQNDLKNFLYFFNFLNFFVFYNNLILNLLLTLLFCYNFFYFFIFLKIYDKKLKKIMLGIKLINYKNFNINSNFYLFKGFPFLDLVTGREQKFNNFYKLKYKLDIQNEVYTMFKFLKLNIVEIFDLINLKCCFEKENLYYNKIIRSFTNTKDIIDFKKIFEKDINKGNLLLKKKILEKTLTLIGYLYNWKVFSILELNFLEENKTNDDKLNQDNQKFFQKLAPNLYNYIYLDSSMVNKIKYFFGTFDSASTKQRENYDFLLKSFFEEEHIIIDQLEILYTKKYGLLKRLKRTCNFFYFNIIEDTENIMLNMFDFLKKIDEKNNEFSVEILGYFFSFKILYYLKIKNEFFFNKKELDSFLTHFFKMDNGLKRFNNNKDITLSKYISLVRNEKCIFNIEKYMSDFNIFIENLLIFHFVNFSKNDKDSLILKNKLYYALEDQFKIVLKGIYEQEFINDFKFYNDNLNNTLLFLLKKTQFDKMLKSIVYRKKEILIDIKSLNYNISSLNKYKIENNTWKFFYNKKTKFEQYHKKASQFIEVKNNNKIKIDILKNENLDLKTLNKVLKSNYFHKFN